MQDRIGVTFNGKDPIPVYETDNGVPVFETDVPYILADQTSLEDPIPVTLVDGPWALGVTGLGPYVPIVPGPLDVVERLPGSFTNFSREFALAAPTAVVGLVCRYTGSPEVTITHGGETFTILEQTRLNGTLTLIALGSGLTVEAANLEVNATGGTLDGGVLRVNEILGVTDPMVGWSHADSLFQPPIPPAVVSGASGGVIKGVFSNGGADRLHVSRVEGADSVFNGFIVVGPNIPEDFSTSGDWSIGVGWEIDGDDFVHTGPTGEISLSHTMTSSTSSTQCYIEVGAGGSVRIEPNDTYGEGTVGYISTASSGRNNATIQATGDVRVRVIAITNGGNILSWVFFSKENATNGDVLQPVMAYRPQWGLVAAEIYE